MTDKGNKRILVTGGTGFLGAYIIRELVNRGYAVRAIRRSNTLPFFIPAPVFEKVEWVQGDIHDLMGLDEAMEDVSGIVHAAAKVSFHKQEKAEMLRTNVEGTANIVNIALDRGIERFIHISSVAALGRTAFGERVDETRQWKDSRLNTNYSRSKYQGELEVWRGIGEGLNGVVVSPATILGYGDWHSSSCAIFRNVYREFPWYTNGINGFVNVQDVAGAVADLLATDITGERFILSSENWTFRQLFDQIAECFGKRKPHRQVTPLLGALAWRMEALKSLVTGKPSLLTRESARVAQSATYFDNAKILRQLPGFRFTPLSQTIKDACKAYLSGQQAI